jgi:nitroreductase
VDTYLAVASKRDWRSYADRPVPPEVERRILDAGRLSGSAMNRQPWVFIVVETPAVKEQVAQVVAAPDNVRTAPLVIAIATEGGRAALDVGRAMQNMFLRLERRGRLVPEPARRRGGRSSARARGRPAAGQHPELRLPQAAARPRVEDPGGMERRG